MRLALSNCLRHIPARVLLSFGSHVAVAPASKQFPAAHHKHEPEINVLLCKTPATTALFSSLPEEYLMPLHRSQRTKSSSDNRDGEREREREERRETAGERQPERDGERNSDSQIMSTAHRQRAEELMKCQVRDKQKDGRHEKKI